MAELNLVVVARFDEPQLAHIAKSQLESVGIQAVLDGEHHVAMDWLISNAVGGVKVLVRESDRERAIATIANYYEDNAFTAQVDTLDGNDEGNQDGDQDQDQDQDNCVCCPNCASTEIGRKRSARK